jgi:hypothetical protein
MKYSYGKVYEIIAQAAEAQQVHVRHLREVKCLARSDGRAKLGMEQ